MLHLVMVLALGAPGAAWSQATGAARSNATGAARSNATGAARSNESNPQSLGPSVEMSLDSEVPTTVYLDLDSDRRIIPPEAVRLSGDLLTWMADNGVDLIIKGGGGAESGMWAVDVTVVVLGKSDGPSADVQDLRQALESSAGKPAPFWTVLSQRPAFYAVRTRQAGMGLVQVMGPGTIRYSMVGGFKAGLEIPSPIPVRPPPSPPVQPLPVPPVRPTPAPQPKPVEPSPIRTRSGAEPKLVAPAPVREPAQVPVQVPAKVPAQIPSPKPQKPMLEARPALESVIPTDPSKKSVDGLMAQAANLRRQKSYAEALKQVQQVLELEPDHPGALYLKRLLIQETRKNPE